MWFSRTVWWFRAYDAPHPTTFDFYFVVCACVCCLFNMWVCVCVYAYYIVSIFSTLVLHLQFTSSVSALILRADCCASVCGYRGIYNTMFVFYCMMSATAATAFENHVRMRRAPIFTSPKRQTVNNQSAANSTHTSTAILMHLTGPIACSMHNTPNASVLEYVLRSAVRQ